MTARLLQRFLFSDNADPDLESHDGAPKNIFEEHELLPFLDGLGYDIVRFDKLQTHQKSTLTTNLACGDELSLTITSCTLPPGIFQISKTLAKMLVLDEAHSSR